MKKVVVIILVIFLIILGGVMSVLPPSSGQLMPYKDDNGNIIENSIAEKSNIIVNDHNIGIYVLAKDNTKPVLLVCGGGPGISQFFMENKYPSCLPEEFVVCYFDYYGTCRSYVKDIDPDTITTELYLSDIQGITDYLCDRFDKEKIFIMGHSFGTRMALETISNNPEKYYAYIAVAQSCDQPRSEKIAYTYMKNEYAKQNNQKMVKEFEKYPLLESEESYVNYFSSPLRDKAMHELGVGTTRDMNSVISGIFWPSLRMKEYTVKERINFWRGKNISNKFAVTHDSFNAFDEVKEVHIPVYFFAGKYDYTCAYELQKEYFEVLNGPVKEFISFDNSAHSPVYEEREVAKQHIHRIISENIEE